MTFDSGLDHSDHKSVYRDVRCYVERREFPVVSVHGSYGARNSGLITAQLVVSEDPNFEDRTYVEFEFIDSGIPETDVTADRPTGCLLCEGEIRSYVVVSTPQGKQCIITCAGTITGHQSVATVTSANAKAKDMPMGVSARFSGASVMKDSKELQRVLLTPLKDNAAPGVPGGIIHLIHTGMHADDTGPSFLKSANERLNIDRCVGAAPDDKTTEIFLMLKETGKLLEDVMNGTVSMGGVPNVEAIKQALLQRVFYQNIYVPPGYLSVPQEVNYRAYTQTQAFSGFKKVLKDKIDLCAKTVDIGNKYSAKFIAGTPEEGLLHTPSVMVQKVWVNIEDHLEDIGYARLEGETKSQWSQVKAHIELGRAALQTIAAGVVWDVYTDAVDTGVSAVKSLMGKDEKTIFGTLMEDSSNALKKLSTPVIGGYSAAIHLAAAAGMALTKKAQELAETNVKLNKRRLFLKTYADELIKALAALEAAENSWIKHALKGTAPQRYHGEVLIPELFFAVPPACNAIMPSMYSQVSIEHNMANIPTRMLLICPSRSGSGRFFRKHSTSYVVAPNIDSIIGTSGKPLILEDAIHGKSVLLEHEKFSGPNPMIMPIANALGYEVNDIAELTKLGAKLKKLHVNGTNKSELDLVQEIAHYRFFEQQIAYTGGSVTCHDWIHLIPGLPAGILVGGTNDLKTAYTAKIEQIQFSIDKNRNSQATVSLSHVMGLGERDNFMIHRRFYDNKVTPTNKIKDLLVAAGQEKNKQVAVALYLSAVIESQVTLLKKKQDAGVSGINAATKQLGSHTAFEQGAVGRENVEVLRTNATVAGYNNEVGGDSGVFKATSTTGVTVQSGPPAPLYDEDPKTKAPMQPTAIVSAANELFDRLKDLSSEFNITEGNPVSMQYDALMHPAWLDDCFLPENIGEVYRYLFGVNSMNEHVKVHGSVAEIVGAFLGVYGDIGLHVTRPIVGIQEFWKFRPNAAINVSDEDPDEFNMKLEAGSIDPRPERGSIVADAVAKIRTYQFSELVQDANEVELSKGKG